MPAAEIEALGEQIISFLDVALAGVDPDRDIPASEKICKEMLRVLDASEDWDKAREEIGAVVARAFADKPEQWAEVARLVGIYLRDTHVEEHPRAQKHMQRRLPGGRTLYYLGLDLLLPVLHALLGDAKPEQRIVFFQSLNEWDVWAALGEALPSLALTPEEFAVLFYKFDLFSRNDGARDEIIDQIMAWAERHSQVARQVVEGWMRRAPQFAMLDREPIRFLVEAIVGERGAQAIDWRDKLIADLSSRPDTEAWKLAALLACFAWPKDPKPSVSLRHDLLLRHVERLPERLFITGLLAMGRDAKEYPVETIETTLKLIQMAEPCLSGSEDVKRHPLIVARIADQAARGLSAHEQDLGPLERLFPILLRVAPSSTRQGIGLDSFLRALAKHKPDEAYTFVEQWLDRHSAELRATSSAFEDIFPLLAGRIGPSGEAQWMVRLIISQSAALRVLGAAFLGARRKSLPLHDAFMGIADNEARALAHQLVGSGIHGKVWIPALFQLGKSRPGVLDTVKKILIEEAAASYPATCKKSLMIWDQTGDGLLSDSANTLLEVRGALEKRLAELDEGHKRKVDIAEIKSIRPAASTWSMVEQRRMQASFDEAHAGSLFLAFAQKVPIARGSQTLMVSTQTEPTPLKELSFSMELPILDIIDPLGARLSRLEHLRQAEALLSPQKDKPE